MKVIDHKPNYFIFVLSKFWRWND